MDTNEFGDRKSAEDRIQGKVHDKRVAMRKLKKWSVIAIVVIVAIALFLIFWPSYIKSQARTRQEMVMANWVKVAKDNNIPSYKIIIQKQ